jgi:hypothetical protein
MYKHFEDDAAVENYIREELLATLRADLDNMEGGEYHEYTDEDRETMRNRIADIEAHFEREPAQMGTMIPKKSMIMTVHVGEAGSDAHQYGLATNLSGNPVIESKTSGKRYSFKWEHLIGYAVQQGIDKVD